MRVLFMTNEFPPHIYGGAGVHVEYLSQALARLATVEVRSFHDQHDEVHGVRVHGHQIRHVDHDGVSAGIRLAAESDGDVLGVQRPGHRGRHCALSHMVCAVRRHHRQDALRHSVRADRPFPWNRYARGSASSLATAMCCRVGSRRSAIEAADAVIAVSKSTQDGHSAPVRCAGEPSPGHSRTASTSTNIVRPTGATRCAPSASTRTRPLCCSSGA